MDKNWIKTYEVIQIWSSLFRTKYLYERDETRKGWSMYNYAVNKHLFVLSDVKHYPEMIDSMLTVSKYTRVKYRDIWLWLLIVKWYSESNQITRHYAIICKFAMFDCESNLWFYLISLWVDGILWWVDVTKVPCLGPPYNLDQHHGDHQCIIMHYLTITKWSTHNHL